jgi:hypothetical protein
VGTCVYDIRLGLTPDSTVLAHVLSLLNQRYDYGLDLYLLSIDEGITGYRDDSLEVRCSGGKTGRQASPMMS